MTDTTDTDERSTDERIAADALDYLRGSFGNADLAKALGGLESPIDVEPLSDDDIRENLLLFREMDHMPEPPTLVEMSEAVVADDHLNAVENAALHAGTQRATQYVEQGVDRPQAVGIVAENMPPNVAKKFVQAELDMAESTGYSHPEDFENDLALLRLEVDLWDETRNRVERLRVWDEMLSFTDYRSDITFRRGEDAETVVSTRHVWAKDSAKAHNRHLSALKRRTPGCFIFETAETHPEERFFPEWDPLPDVEDFVFPEGSR